MKMAARSKASLFFPSNTGVCNIFVLLWLLYCFSANADITDGNAEHLKREHSLIKPYQGEYRLIHKLL